jgi:protein O-mannosyl-transferase
MGRRTEKKKRAVQAERPRERPGAGKAARKSEGRPWVHGARSHSKAVTVGICVALAVVAVAVFGRTVRYEFLNYDDNDYVSANREVNRGLTWDGVVWAFSHAHAMNWHPLTTVSHMLDCQLFGLRAGWHHFTSVLIHAAGTVALFLALLRLTGALWRSAMAAALFCLHPLHVESVAWVAERKDVLSGLFFGLTLWAYAGYAQRPFSWMRYGAVAGLFCLGLLCKPMLVTLPFVLLLLDYWPLGRWGGKADGRWKVGKADGEMGRWGDGESARGAPFASPHLPISPSPHPSAWRLILEKLPLLTLSAASCLATYEVQSSYGIVIKSESWGMRLQTALTAYAGYLIQAVWPFGLAVPYPRLREPAILAAVACGLALAAITVAVVILARRGMRYPAVGWFWYLGMLVPVIGLVTIGDQSMADRYTYLPLTGIFVAVVWGASDLLPHPLPLSQRERGDIAPLSKERRVIRNASILAAGAVLTLCAWRTTDQLQYWHDSETLMRRAIAMTKDNPLAHTNLAVALRGTNRPDEEIAEYREAIRILPEYYRPHDDLGLVLSENGRWPEAVDEYRAALRCQPNNPLILYHWGVTEEKMGRPPDAEGLFRESLRHNPATRLAEEVRKTLAFSLVKDGRLQEAIHEFGEMLRHDPNQKVALNSLAWLMATCPDAAIRNGPEAVALARKAAGQCRVDDPEVLDTLAAAYAEAGQFQEAVKAGESAHAAAEAANNQQLGKSIQQRLLLYRVGKPYREAKGPLAPAGLAPAERWIGH